MFKQLARDTKDFILDLFYPPFCLCCRTLINQGLVLCDHCLHSLPPIASRSLEITPSFSLPVIAVTEYEGIMRKLVLRKLYRDQLASVDLGRIMARTLSFPLQKIDYVVPIPLHWTRTMWRGFNQASLIAQELEKATHIPLLPCLKRARRTLYQSRLDPSDRAENIKGAFVLKSSYVSRVKDKHIALIDDVCTTGETLREAARVLRRSGAASLVAFVACRGK